VTGFCKHTSNQPSETNRTELLSTSTSPTSQFLWFAGNPDFTLEAAGNVVAVELLVAFDDDSLDLQSVMLVFALRLTGRVVLEHAIVKVDFAGTTFDDDYAAFSWIWV
jgi:hypothetical protein